jgi:hypothetical protein
MQDSVSPIKFYSLRFAFYILLLLITACTTASPGGTPEPIHVQYTFAAQPWLAKVDTCAGSNIVISVLRAADFQNPQSADLVIYVGQPDDPASYAYQIGTDALLVIVNPQNPIHNLTIAQVEGLFTGRIQTWKDVNGTATQVQAWVFPASDDVQQIFEHTILGGSPVTSTARLANSPDEMLQAIQKDVNAIGIITRRWNTGNVPVVFTGASSLPVLAIARSKPEGALAQILACLQK